MLQSIKSRTAVAYLLLESAKNRVVRQCAMANAKKGERRKSTRAAIARRADGAALASRSIGITLQLEFFVSAILFAIFFFRFVPGLIVCVISLIAVCFERKSCRKIRGENGVER